ncbi:MAG TPA: RagB/SusD family nutrient uptake outer membrane protein [Cyclobacteriaceae bacterium]|nr:RagB/SusD family nutrient uptake outer membrane protein [Cyclobacteriaceae bacterium]
MNTILNSIGHRFKTRPLFVLLLICFAGCEDLNEKPVGIATPATFYNSIPQCEAALAGSMSTLWGWYVAPGYGSGDGLSSWFSNDDQLEGGDLNIESDHASGLWTAHYKALANINSLLHAVKNGSLATYPPEEIDKIVAQAKFLRAFNYFYLVRMFGDLPLITEDTPDPVNTPITKRTSVAEVYDLIVSDLTFAMTTIPSKTDLGGATPGRPTSGAAKGLLAKVYLTMATAPLNITGNYAKAASLAKEIIDGGEYALIPNIWEVFLKSNKYGSEAMWSFNSTEDDPQTDENIGKPDEIDGYGGEQVAMYFDTTFAHQPRRDAYLLRYALEDNAPNPPDTILYTTAFDTGLPFIRKLYNEPYITLDEGFGGSSANWFILRYADILLIYAEAANRVNGAPTQDAVDAINQIINRANGTTGKEAVATIGMTMQVFEDKVIQERSWELCFELGDRWFDLIRKRILDKAIAANGLPTALVNFTPDDYLFPIPTFDAKTIGQNPGY